ncbi:MAG TPA: hypothetical protein VN088_06175 [Nocardioides sp.]|nr:hypothetical protein [Nocardioides sp.]
MTIVLGAPGLTRTVLDVPVEEGPVPGPWDAAVVAEPWYWADADRLRFAADDVVVYVEPGRVLISAPDADARAHADWLLYATATRALLTFRREFNLHAGMVVTPSGAAVAVLGDSGAGKSTTTVELLRRGWTLGSDDIVVVRHTDAGPVAHPVDRPIHLASRAVDLLGGDPAVGRPLPYGDKRAYTITADLAPRPLAAIVVLAPDPDAVGVEAHRVDGLAALPAIGVSADRYGICRLPEHRADFLAWNARLCEQVPIWRLVRPVGSDTVAAVADEIVRISG